MKKRNQTISTTNQYLRASNREAKQEKKSKNTSVTLLVPCGSRRMTRGPFKLNEPWNQCFHFLAHFVPSQKIFKIENIEKKNRVWKSNNSAGSRKWKHWERRISIRQINPPSRWLGSGGWTWIACAPAEVDSCLSWGKSKWGRWRVEGGWGRCQRERPVF